MLPCARLSSGGIAAVRMLSPHFTERLSPSRCRARLRPPFSSRAPESAHCCHCPGTAVSRHRECTSVRAADTGIEHQVGAQCVLSGHHGQCWGHSFKSLVCRSQLVRAEPPQSHLPEPDTSWASPSPQAHRQLRTAEDRALGNPLRGRNRTQSRGGPGCGVRSGLPS